MSERAADNVNAGSVVTRKVTVPDIRAPGAQDAVREGLGGCSGVLAVRPDVERLRVRVTYDASRVDFDQLMAHLEAAGYPAARDFWSRVKAHWFQYLDGNVRAGSGGGGGACCSRPSDVYASRSRRQ
ncbi:MAG TPA: heavy-metal-associated domain-containing protein [Gammaproteobacteria bacterium]|nr:heavy-metal-associated domain-containing protein [Gammaproteobacteria bacterium]